MKKIIICLFFCALVGTQFKIIQGVYWSDFFCFPLLIYALFNIGSIKVNKDLIARTSFVYSGFLLMSGFVNGTLTNTVYLNFTRIFVEGAIAYVSLVIAIKSEKELLFFKWLFYIYSVVFLVLSATSLTMSMELEGNFQALDIQSGRNGMAVTNLLIVIMLSFLVLRSPKSVDKIFFLLFPFLVFNIFFSASRFSVISLGVFVIFMLYWTWKKFSAKRIVVLLFIAAFLPYVVELLMSKVDSNIMDYSSELLTEKITKNEDGGFAYRLFDLNIDVIKQWSKEVPIYMWFFGDGKSITHGIFSFTFCCTGVLGFLYFVISHIKMIIWFWRKSFICRYISFLVFIFFFNDIVTNSRFIICVNTLIYMGMLAYMISFDRMYSDNNRKAINTARFQIN